MDLSHATIPTFDGIYVTFHPTMGYQVEYHKEPMNEESYINEELKNLSVYTNSLAPKTLETNNKEFEGVWTMHFDGVMSKTGAEAEIVLTSPMGSVKTFSYRLEFNCTNNIVEYEALSLGLKLAHDTNIKC